jgi:hypothetical protein
MFLKKYKFKLGSWMFSVLENTVFGFASRIRANLVEVLEVLPDAASNSIVLFSALMFIVTVAAAGAVIIPCSLVYVFIYLLGTENKELVAGIAFFLLGVFYLTLSLIILKIVVSKVRHETSKVTKKAIKQIEGK